MDSPRRPGLGSFVLVALSALLPAGVALLLNFLRPDLMRETLALEQAPVAVRAWAVITAAGVALQAAAAWAVKKRAGRVALSVAGLGCFTLPAVLMVVFGPIVAAFMSDPG